MSKLYKQPSRFENRDSEPNNNQYSTKSVASITQSNTSQERELINKSKFIIGKSEIDNIPQIIRSLNPSKNNHLYNNHVSLFKDEKIQKTNIVIEDANKIEKIVSVVAQKLKDHNKNTCDKAKASVDKISSKIDDLTHNLTTSKQKMSK